MGRGDRDLEKRLRKLRPEPPDRAPRRAPRPHRLRDPRAATRSPTRAGARSHCVCCWSRWEPSALSATRTRRLRAPPRRRSTRSTGSSPDRRRARRGRTHGDVVPAITLWCVAQDLPGPEGVVPDHRRWRQANEGQRYDHASSWNHLRQDQARGRRLHEWIPVDGTVDRSDEHELGPDELVAAGQGGPRVRGERDTEGRRLSRWAHRLRHRVQEAQEEERRQAQRRRLI